MSVDVNTHKLEESREFEPTIVAFLCNWCSYAGADLAGTSRAQVPPNVRVVRVMCTGRVDSVFVLGALSQGADGVLVAGCHPGDCHYQTGNLRARRRMTMLRELLAAVGVEPERLWLRWVGASEGELFAVTVREMVEELRRLGPSRLAATWSA
jgi:F420-non-reducing hydrogenase iron-sulfur subunit